MTLEIPSLVMTGRIAVVTGGASGLGRATALALKRAGARVVALDKDREGLAALAGEEIDGRALDVTERAAVFDAVAAIAKDRGRLDILVTAAGVLQRPLPPEAIPEREWDRVIDVNLKGTFHAAAAAGAHMAAAGGGAIVTIASITGLEPGPLHAYGPSKAAILALTRSLAAEWGPRGVRVNAIAPGYVKTPALDRALHFGILSEERLSQVTAARRMITAEEVANVVLFLASPLSSGVTGAIVPVDAGALVMGGWAPFTDRVSGA